MTSPRLLAFCALLATPDPPDLRTSTGVRRGHVLTCPGDRAKQEVLLRTVMAAFLQQRKQGPEEVFRCARLATPRRRARVLSIGRFA